MQAKAQTHGNAVAVWMRWSESYEIMIKGGIAMQRKWHQLGVALLLVMLLLTLPVQSFATEAEEPEQSAEQIEETVSVVETETLPAIENNAAESRSGVTGWVYNDDGTISYQVDGVLLRECIYQIDGYYYGFDYRGAMYVDTEFDIWYMDEYGDFVYDTYRARSDGTLFVNEWRDYGYGYSEYYGADCAKVNGVAEIDGIKYVFTYYTLVREQTACVDGVWYYGDKNGVAHVLQNNAWSEMDGKFYYVQDGSLCEDGVYLINGKYYGFNYFGIMYCDDDFSVYDGEQGRYLYFRASESGALLVNQWYTDDYGVKYYYGENGIAGYGFTRIDGVLYYFNENGALETDAIIGSGANHYIISSKGEVCVLANNAWTNAFGHYYYVMDGEMCMQDVYKIDGVYYGFDAGGRMFADTTFGFYNSSKGGMIYYHADKSGALYENKWYHDQEGEWYYFGEGGQGADGIVKLGTAYYAFSGGRMYADTRNSVRTLDNDGVRRTCYFHAREDGTLCVNTWMQKNGKYYYYGAKGIAPRGAETVNGVQYYFDDGEMVTSQVVHVNNVPHRADSNGHLTALANNAWTKVEGEYYYVKDGVLCENSIHEIDGALYAFSADGEMYCDTDFDIYGKDISGTRREMKGFAGADGKLYVNRWYALGAYWYYSQADGTAATGMQTIGGKQYYFGSNCILKTNTVIEVNGTAYLVDKSGVMTEAVNNGWFRFGDAYYYFQNGTMLTDGVYQINGVYYGFNYDGRMYDNELFECEWEDPKDPGDYRYETFFAQEGGALYMGCWAQDEDGYWYYLNDNGVACKQMQYIYGTQYYFDYEGRMVTEELLEIDNNGSAGYYYAGQSGELYLLNRNGWTQADGYWFYCSNGEVCSDDVVEINGAYYAFDYNGIMYRNTGVYSEDGRFHASQDGSLVRNMWVQYNSGYWRYYGDDCAAVDGLQVINGKQYYFDNYSALHDCLLMVGGKTYRIGRDMVMEELADGWVIDPENGQWAYVKDGRLVSYEILTINGKTYAFGNRTLQCGGIVYCDDAYYLADENGCLVTTTGWVSYRGSYFYVQSDYTLYEGWLTLGSKSYYLYPNMACNTVVSLYQNGRPVLYIARTDGSLIRYTRDGFYNLDPEQRCYVRDGKLVRGEWFDVDGKRYYAFERGIIAQQDTYWIDGKNYLFDENGVLATGGWYTTNFGQYYTYADGTYATGMMQIDGKRYIFYDEGDLIKDRVYSVDGVYYVINRDGEIISQLSGDGWVKVNGEYYYLRNNVPAYNEIVLENGKYYYFDHGFNMVRNEQVRGMYFGADGAAKTGWFKLGAVWYYADASGNLANGLTEINGSTYYFEYGGRMRIGQFRIDGRYYSFAANGALTSVSNFPNGWSYADGEAYYYKNGLPYTGWVGSYYIQSGLMARSSVIHDGKAYYYVDASGAYVKNQFAYDWETGAQVYATANGMLAQNQWVQVGSDWYYFMGLGMVHNGYRVIDGKACLFVNGVYQGAYTPNNRADGWVQRNGEWYYSIAGAYLRNARRYIGGNWYTFDSDGAMVTNQFVSYEFINQYGGDDIVTYYYGADGTRASYVGWKKIDGVWVYFNQDHTPRVGWLEDNGKVYYMSGVNGYRTGYMVYYDILYRFGTDGVLIGSVTKQNGWMTVDGMTVYFRDGKLLGTGSYYAEILQIDGKEYVFDGRVLQQNVITNINGDMRYVDKNGMLVSKAGWYKFGDTWIYVLNDGTVANGVWLINGVSYCFEDYVLFE